MRLLSADPWNSTTSRSAARASTTCGTSRVRSRRTRSSSSPASRGSGKSSLAFDTLYAEGQRRYVESLSSYARQFLGQMEKPQVDPIRGLSPTIAIEQKSAANNPRSTVGTITEITDYLRVLYARVGEQHCHLCGKPASGAEAEQIARSPRARRAARASCCSRRCS